MTPTQAQIEEKNLSIRAYLAEIKRLKSEIERLAAAAEVEKRDAAASRIEQIAFDKLIAERDKIEAAAIERCAQEKIDVLAKIYLVNVAAAAAVALVCDEQLDKTGALLQKVREAAAIRALKEKS